MKKIFDIEFNSVVNVETKFEEVFNECDMVFYESKETFHHDEEGLSFDYKYVIVGECCEGTLYYSLALVPCANSLGEKKRSEVALCCGLDEEDLTIYDIWSYGCNVQFGCESEEGEEFNDEYFSLIASVFESINSLRGFYLDRYVNRIGNNGWDMLEDFINDVPFLSKLYVG